MSAGADCGRLQGIRSLSFRRFDLLPIQYSGNILLLSFDKFNLRSYFIRNSLRYRARHYFVGGEISALPVCKAYAAFGGGGVRFFMRTAPCCSGYYARIQNRIRSISCQSCGRQSSVLLDMLRVGRKRSG